MSSDRMFRPNEEQLELLKRWYAPDVAEPAVQEATNAFGMTAADIVEPTKQPAMTAEIEPQPARVTAEELEQIRQSAQQEGFDQGYSKGHERGLLTGHEEGYPQGLEQGKADGHQQGYNEGKAEVESQLALLNQLIAQLNAPLDNQELQIEQALLALALDVAKKIVHTEVTQNHQPILQSINDGVRQLSGGEPVIVRLNPQDIDTVAALWSSEQLAQRHMVLEADLTLDVGSCDIACKMSTVTLDLTSRINQVFDDFHSQPKPQLGSAAHDIAKPAGQKEFTSADEEGTSDEASQNPSPDPDLVP